MVLDSVSPSFGSIPCPLPKADRPIGPLLNEEIGPHRPREGPEFLGLGFLEYHNSEKRRRCHVTSEVTSPQDPRQQASFHDSTLVTISS